MPLSLSQALDAEVKQQGVPADQIDKVVLDQKCRAAAIQVILLRMSSACCCLKGIIRSMPCSVLVIRQCGISSGC